MIEVKDIHNTSSARRSIYKDEQNASQSVEFVKQLELHKNIDAFKEFAKPTKVLTKSKLTSQELTREDYLGLHLKKN